MNEFTRATCRASPPPLAAGATIEPMPSTVFTTAGLPARAQFEAWRAFTAPCIEALSRDGVERGFEARSQSWRFDPFLLQHSRLPACGYRRSEAQAERDDLDHWLIGICLRGQHRQRSGDRVTEMAPGRPHVFRTSAAFEAQRDGDEMEWIGLYLPRDAVPELDPALAAVAGGALPGPTAEVFSAMLAALVRRLPEVSAAEGRHLATSLKALLAAACAHDRRIAQEEGQELVVASQLARIRRLIREDIGSASLSPARLCRRAQVSRSTLYRLFEPYGGVARYIQRERLRFAHRRLSDPEDRDSVARVAEAAGLFDPSSFSRAFRREFGCTPADVRAMARAGLVMPPAPTQRHAGTQASLAAILREL